MSTTLLSTMTTMTLLSILRERVKINSTTVIQSQATTVLKTQELLVNKQGGKKETDSLTILQTFLLLNTIWLIQMETRSINIPRGT
jgi:hypothetical protein